MPASIPGCSRPARWSRELYERFVTFMDRFHVAGWKRWVLVEPASEAATIGTGGLVLALALALPAFYETSDEDWLKKSRTRGAVSRSLRQRGRRARDQA